MSRNKGSFSSVLFSDYFRGKMGDFAKCVLLIIHAERRIFFHACMISYRTLLF